MTLKEISQLTDEIIILVSEGHISKALTTVAALTEKYGLHAIRSDVEVQRETYQNILKHSFSGIHDPERDRVYRRLQVSLFELTDALGNALTDKLTHTEDSRLARHLMNTGVRDEIIRQAAVLLRPVSRAARNGQLKELFDLIRLSGKLTATESDFIHQLFSSRETPWHEKCIMVSALQLGTHHYFDPSKIILLIEAIHARENEVWQRALVALILLLDQYRLRIPFYPAIMSRLTLLYDQREIIENSNVMIIQFLRSYETEKVKQKMQDEILPEVGKLRPRIQDKLGLENLISEIEGEDKNPDWQVIFNDVPNLYRRMEELSNMHLEGIDVFMSAFSQLKHFDFFGEMMNWFMPFYSPNPVAFAAMKDTVEEAEAYEFINTMALSANMCNSDKYSFVLNLKHLPAPQRSMMINLLKLEMEAMKEHTASDAVILQPAVNKAIFTAYLQDIYRFYHLFKRKEEFYNPFSHDLALYQMPFFRTLLGNSSVLRNIAEYFFEKDYFEEAFRIYCTLEDKNDREVLEKMAYCLQRMKRYSEALAYYDKALLFDPVKPWLYKNMAFCCRQMKDYPAAIKYYLDALKIEPDNLHLHADLGRCYLSVKDYETALKYYFKIEYLAPSNTRIMRPIGWCSFMLGNTVQAGKYYQRLLASGDAKAWDYLNAGHVAWCSRQFNQAIIYYKECFERLNRNEQQFIDGFTADTDILIAHGIPANEIPMMIDVVLFGG